MLSVLELSWIEADSSILTLEELAGLRERLSGSGRQDMDCASFRSLRRLVC